MLLCGCAACFGTAGPRQPSEDNVLSDLLLATGAKVAGPVPMMARTNSVSSELLLERILSSLDDDKAEDVVSIDLRGRSSVADYMVICSGRSSRQVGAIAEKLAERLKTELGRSTKIEGKGQGDWVLIDTGDVIVHVFRPEVRDFYQLEKMWTPSSASMAQRAPSA